MTDTEAMSAQIIQIAIDEGLVWDDMTARSDDNAFQWRTGEPSIFASDAHRAQWNAKLSAAHTAARDSKPKTEPAPNVNHDRKARRRVTA